MIPLLKNCRSFFLFKVFFSSINATQIEGSGENILKDKNRN